MKKYSWIVALLLALTFTFIGCGADPIPPEPDVEMIDYPLDAYNYFGGQPANQKGWASDGHNEATKKLGYKVENFKAAKYLVLELKEGGLKGGLSLTWGVSGDAGEIAALGLDNAGWVDKKIASDSGALDPVAGRIEDNILKIDLEKALLKYDAFSKKNSLELKLLISYYQGVDNLVEKAYLQLPADSAVKTTPAEAFANAVGLAVTVGTGANDSITKTTVADNLGGTTIIRAPASTPASTADGSFTVDLPFNVIGTDTIVVKYIALTEVGVIKLSLNTIPQSYKDLTGDGSEQTISIPVASFGTSLTTQLIFGDNQYGEGANKQGAKWKLKIIDISVEEVDEVLVDKLTIPGLNAPVGTATGQTTITDLQYNGTISWNPALSGGKFANGTAYTATITLKANVGYTFKRIIANSFKVAGATTVTNNKDSTGKEITVTASFPAAPAPDEVNVNPIAANVGGTYETTVTPITGGIEIDQKTASWGGGSEGIGWFKVTLTGGKKLSDYVVLTCTIEATEGDGMNKSPRLTAWAAEPTGYYSGTQQDISSTSGNPIGGTLNTPTNITFDISDVKDGVDLNVVYLCISLWSSPVKYNVTNIKLSNVK